MQSPLSTLSAWIAVLMVPVIDASPRMYAAQETGQKPHVVLILADDLGWSDLACYGSDLHETPHLDALAKDGFVLPMPMRQARCALHSSFTFDRTSPCQTRHDHLARERQNQGNRSLLEPITRDALPLSEKTLAEYLKQAGYYTAHVGKWHLGPAESYPQPHGFDVNIGAPCGGHLRVFYPYRGLGIFRGLAMPRSRTRRAG